MQISTHTLTWSVTAIRSRLIVHFAISTHTLTWSVTVGNVFDTPEFFDFNSHAHVERDAMAWQRIDVLWHFNSHAHVERDSFRVGGKRMLTNFNSHAHVERDT